MNRTTQRVKDIVYRRLRSGGILNFIVYYVTGHLYWLFGAFRFYIGTRVVEIPWILSCVKKLLPNNSNILQIGNALLYRGVMQKHAVTVIDMNAEELSHKCLRVYKTDIRSTNDIRNNSFDAVISISTIEHIGLMGVKFDNGDLYAISRIHSWLKPNGLFMMSVPFGKHLIQDDFRIYDCQDLSRILGNLFTIKDIKYAMWNGWRWIYVSSEVAEKMPLLNDNANMNCGVVLIVARRNHDI